MKAIFINGKRTEGQAAATTGEKQSIKIDATTMAVEFVLIKPLGSREIGTRGFDNIK